MARDVTKRDKPFLWLWEARAPCQSPSTHGLPDFPTRGQSLRGLLDSGRERVWVPFTLSLWLLPLHTNGRWIKNFPQVDKSLTQINELCRFRTDFGKIISWVTNQWGGKGVLVWLQRSILDNVDVWQASSCFLKMGCFERQPQEKILRIKKKKSTKPDIDNPSLWGRGGREPNKQKHTRRKRAPVLAHTSNSDGIVAWWWGNGGWRRRHAVHNQPVVAASPDDSPATSLTHD